MASTRQRHPSVPTSNSPPIPEWADHFWYVLRVSALQANDKLSDEDVATLVQSFYSYRVTLPCPMCREHYVADWELFPFTTEHAKSALVAMKWVEDLRIRIEGRKKTGGGAAVVATAAVPVPVSVPVPAVSARTYATQALASRATALLRTGRVGTPGTVTPTASSVAAAQARSQVLTANARSAAGVRSASGEAMKRTVAIQSALQQTTANRAGPRGCNCGKRR